MAKKIIFDQKNVVVTGGAGFIGSHLCDELVKNNKVICIDNLICGHQSNIDHLLRNPNFIFIRRDINEYIDLESIKELERFDVKFQGIQEIYNLAVPTSPKDFEKFTKDTLLANTVGVYNILEMAVKYNAKVLHASSSVVYGGRIDDEFLFSEDYVGTIDQLSPRSAYDMGKKMAESMVVNYSKVHNLDGRIVRIFRAYGPRMALNQGHLIPDFINNALANKDLTIYGPANFTTSLIYISDVIDAIVKVMQLPSDIGPLNIGTDINVKILSVCEKIIDMLNSKSGIKYSDPLMFLTELGLPDTTKARNRLGWIPIVSLKQGLEKTIEFANAHQQLLSY